MLNTVMSSGALVCVALLTFAQPAHAQQTTSDAGKQTLNFTLGYFTPLGADARATGDVLNENRTFLIFDVNDFNGASVGGEWLIPLVRHVEGGIGVSFSRRTVPSIYQDFVDSDGTEVEQELRLRLVPLAFTLRLIPTDPRSPIQPYFGGGLGIINWRYSETGEFIDFGAGNEIFRDTFEKSGSNVGAIILGGLRVVGDSASAGFEIKYQNATGDLDDNFTAPKIDLGGWTYNFTAGFRF